MVRGKGLRQMPVKLEAHSVPVPSHGAIPFPLTNSLKASPHSLKIVKEQLFPF